MQSRVLQRLALAAAIVLGAGVSVVSTAAARPERPGPQARRSTFNLFGGSVNVSTVVNRVNCNITNYGNICYDKTGSGTQEGAFWPAGTPDNYVFNTGLQLGATVSYGAGTGPWVGDTVGVFFMDPRGTQIEGSPVDGTYDGTNANDLAVWPTAANVNDTSLYNAALVDVARGGTSAAPRKTLSQQDTWVRYWDGNTSIVAGRKHAMGVLVEQRGLAWAFPSGNEDILYFLFRFINITATDPAKYAGLATAGYTSSEISDIVAVAQDFHNRVLSSYGVTLPASGYTFKNMFAAAFQDPDVGVTVTDNYSTASLPFALVGAYEADFYDPPWAPFPPDIFHPPFAVAPGFEAVKYLKSPVDPTTGREFGITIWGNTCNGCGLLDDARGIWQMYRYISGQVRASLGDGSCSVSNPLLYHTCAALQQSSDTRFFESSGPFDLGPGQSSVIVIALIFAPAVGTQPASGSGGFALPAYTLTPGASLDVKPGIPPLPDSLALGNGTTTQGQYVRTVDRAMGWAAFSDANGNGRIEQTEVQTTPGSILNKALRAQAIFDAKFLLPFAPEPPGFFLVPGDNKVTVVWQKSRTETVGDPYFAVASDVTSALYDPNYRQNDVEGYRIWRGRTRAEMQVIAQFDYAGTYFVDYTGTFTNSSYGSQCAPELGITTTCPASFFPHKVSLVGDVVQVKARVQLASGDVLVTEADTAVTGGGTGYPALVDNGVPFSYVDSNVRDGFQYFYSVTAFDVNSITSTGIGNTSLQSGMVARSVTPRASSGQETAGSVGAMQVLAGDGSVLNTSASYPTIDAKTGIFSGPMPPSNGITSLGFSAFLPQILGTGTVTVTVDSIIPGDVFGGQQGVYWFTGQGAGAPGKFSVSISGDPFSGDHTASGNFSATTATTSKALRFGGDSTYSLYGAISFGQLGDYRVTSQGRANVNGDPGNSLYNGPRWWAGAANENTSDPNGGICDFFSNPGCVSSNRTAGALPGVDSLFYPLAYGTVNSQPGRQIEGITAFLSRAADFKVYWNASTAGLVDSVVDVTHKVKAPFSTKLRAGWGILNDSSFVGVTASLTRDKNNSLLTWSDIACVDPIPRYTAVNGSFSPALCGGTAQTPAVFMNHARLSPIAARGASYNGTATVTATGNGFIFYLAGHFFLMQMTALPVNTVWNARFYAGSVTGSAATQDFAFEPADFRPASVPGLRVRIAYEGSTLSNATNDTVFTRIHTVPDPYYVTSSLESTGNNKVIRFVNLPKQCIIRIYSLSGILIRVLTHNDAGGGSEATWDLRNRNQQFVASGVYFYHVEAADGRTKVGRFTVVNFAQ